MKIRPMETMEPSGAALDAWVARAEGHGTPRLVRRGARSRCEVHDVSLGWKVFSPSTDWDLADTIIEREHIGLREVTVHHQPMFEAMLRRGGVTWFAHGELPLIAAMRAYVRSRFPEEMLRTERFE